MKINCPECAHPFGEVTALPNGSTLKARCSEAKCRRSFTICGRMGALTNKVEIHVYVSRSDAKRDAKVWSDHAADLDKLTLLDVRAYLRKKEEYSDWQVSMYEHELSALRKYVSQRERKNMDALRSAQRIENDKANAYSKLGTNADLVETMRTTLKVWVHRLVKQKKLTVAQGEDYMRKCAGGEMALTQVAAALGIPTMFGEDDE